MIIFIVTDHLFYLFTVFTYKQICFYSLFTVYKWFLQFVFCRINELRFIFRTNFNYTTRYILPKDLLQLKSNYYVHEHVFSDYILQIYLLRIVCVKIFVQISPKHSIEFPKYVRMIQLSPLYRGNFYGDVILKFIVTMWSLFSYLGPIDSKDLL